MRLPWRTGPGQGAFRLACVCDSAIQTAEHRALGCGGIAALPTIRTTGDLMGSHRSSRSQGDRVITLIATKLARSRMTVGTLLVLALALGWDVQNAWCATPADVRLVELAGSKFANLTKAELALLRFPGANQAPGDAFAAAGPSSNPDDPSNDPAHADEWSKDREVRAAVIWWLCADPEAVRYIKPQGLRLLGAKMVGGLNLSTVRVPFAITLRNCSIPEVIELTSTTIGTLDLSGSYTGPIHASLINVADNLVLGNGFHAVGQVALTRAKIGLLTANAGHFRYSPEPGDRFAAINPALNLSQSQIKSGVNMDQGESQGAVVLLHI